MTTDRQTDIDVCRGIVIVLMIVGHASPPYVVVQGIYGFHMPFFFILSGMLYNRNKWQTLGIKELITKRWKAYVVPYFILSFINLIINIPVDYYKGWHGKELLFLTLKHVFWIFYSYGNASRTPNCTPLWFLLCIFVCSIFFYYLLRLKNRFFQIFACVISSTLAYILCVLDVVQLPWHIDSALLGVVFMYIGLYIKENKIIEKIDTKDSILCLIGLFIIGFYCIFTNPRIDINTNKLNNIILMYVGAISISVFIIICTKAFFSMNKILELYGKNTILFMGFNYAINTYSNAIWTRTPVLNSISYTWWLNVFINLIVLYVVIIVWNKLKEKYPRIALF